MSQDALAELAQRLLDHAECHREISLQDEEQLQWTRDLEESAAVIRLQLEQPDRLGSAARGQRDVVLE